MNKNDETTLSLSAPKWAARGNVADLRSSEDVHCEISDCGRLSFKSYL